MNVNMDKNTNTYKNWKSITCNFSDQLIMWSKYKNKHKCKHKKYKYKWKIQNNYLQHFWPAHDVEGLAAAWPWNENMCEKNKKIEMRSVEQFDYYT